MSGTLTEIKTVTSNSGAVNSTASPQVAAGTNTQQMLILKGGSASDYLILEDGDGLSLNGPCELTDQQALTLIWDGSVWFEISRRA